MLALSYAVAEIVGAALCPRGRSAPNSSPSSVTNQCLRSGIQSRIRTVLFLENLSLTVINVSLVITVAITTLLSPKQLFALLLPTKKATRFISWSTAASAILYFSCWIDF